MSDWNDDTKLLRHMPPALVSQAGIIGDEILTQMRRANLDVGVAFYTHLLNASAIAVAEMQMSEDRFVQLCREQYQLYLEFQFEETGAVRT